MNTKAVISIKSYMYCSIRLRKLQTEVSTIAPVRDISFFALLASVRNAIQYPQDRTRYGHEGAGSRPLELSLRDACLKVDKRLHLCRSALQQNHHNPQDQNMKDQTLEKTESSQALTCWLIRISTATLRSPSAAAIATSTCV